MVENPLVMLGTARPLLSIIGQVPLGLGVFFLAAGLPTYHLPLPANARSAGVEGKMVGGSFLFHRWHPQGQHPPLVRCVSFFFLAAGFLFGRALNTSSKKLVVAGLVVREEDKKALEIK